MSLAWKKKNSYGWINEKLGKEFKYERSSRDSEELALWYLHLLKEEGKTDEEIVSILGSIFKKVSKSFPEKESCVWLGFNLKEICRLNLWKKIVIDSYQREYNNFVKRDKLASVFFNSEWKNLEGSSKAKDFENLNSNVIFEKQELGLKWFNSEGQTFDVVDIDKLKNYSEFKESIENNKQISQKDAQKNIVRLHALLSYSKDDKILDAFARAFGEDKKFKEEYYETFEKSWKMSPNFLNLKTIHYPYVASPDKKINRRNMLVAMSAALRDAANRLDEEED